MTAHDTEHLTTLINNQILTYGPACDLNHIDVSKIEDMDALFCGTFNGNIARWDVSNVYSMSSMFERSQFNGDLSRWNVSGVTSMSCMFADSIFNNDIAHWTVSSVISMRSMFCESVFNNDISQWDVSNVEHMDSMFARSKFNNDISRWNISSGTSMEEMFLDSCFNQNVSTWDLSNAEVYRMFATVSFQAAMPKMPLTILDRTVDASYRGSLANSNNYEHAMAMFGSDRILREYLHDTASTITRLHIECVLRSSEKPTWCLPSVFERIQDCSTMCKTLDLELAEWPLYIQQALEKETHPMEELAIGNLLDMT